MESLQGKDSLLLDLIRREVRCFTIAILHNVHGAQTPAGLSVHKNRWWVPHLLSVIKRLLKFNQYIPY